MMDSNFWTAVAIAAVAPLLGLLAAIWKLRREGISAASIEEIRDRARFRTHMLERIKVVEERERELIARHENRERDLLTQIAELHLKIEALESRLRDESATSKSERDRIEHKYDDAHPTDGKPTEGTE